MLIFLFVLNRNICLLSSKGLQFAWADIRSLLHTQVQTVLQTCNNLQVLNMDNNILM